MPSIVKRLSTLSLRTKLIVGFMSLTFLSAIGSAVICEFVGEGTSAVPILVALVYAGAIAIMAGAWGGLFFYRTVTQPLEELSGHMDAALSNMSQGLCLYDANSRLIIANARFAAMYGEDPEALTVGTTLRTILERRVANGTAPRKAETYVQERLSHVASRRPWTMIDALADGRMISVVATPLAQGGYVVTHEDITERLADQAKIAHLAYHDGLTGLPNRTQFNDALDTALGTLAADDSVATLCLDLDHFKAVNDTLGHPVGDALLTAVADRLRTNLGPHDLVSRLGGDEFAIIQRQADQPNAAGQLAERLIKALSAPYDVAGHHIVIGTSVGIAVAPQDGDTPEIILRNADMALYRAKADGRSTARFFEPDMDTQMQIRRRLEIDLRTAVHENAFDIHYQPLVDLKSNRVSGFEALLRWTHPERGPIPPVEFIPLLEELNLIGQVGAWVLNKACQEAKTWPGQQKIAVNLSALQFKQRAVVLDVAAALLRSGLAPNRLELEITESVLLQDTAETLDTLNAMRALGVRISMDDFGTGYSSLSYLRSFPFDKIKIDQSFVRDMTDTADSVAIIRAVTGLGYSLGMSTTAEGVETHAQLMHLRAEGCTEVQGYYLGRPQPASAIAGMIAAIEITLNSEAA